MAAVYSQRFIAAHGLTGRQSYTVPRGHVAIIRDVDAFTHPGLSFNEMYLEGDLGQAIWYDAANPPSPHTGQWRGRQVFEEGETFTVHATIGAWDVTVSGYLLTA